MSEAGDVIQVVQLPIISEELRFLKGYVDARVSVAENLVCTEETLQDAKKLRAELRKEFDSLEAKRKEVKQAIMGPYNDFEAVYKECVSEAYTRAFATLKSKIDDVEATVKDDCKAELEEYFSELCQAHHVEWLKFDDCGVKITLTNARQTTYKKLKEQILTFVVSVSNAISALSEMEFSEELIAEFKTCIDMPLAIKIVSERHERIEAERIEQEKRQAILEKEQEAVRKVVDALPPPVSAEKKEPEKVLTTTFKCKATISKLKALKEYMVQNGIEIIT